MRNETQGISPTFKELTPTSSDCKAGGKLGYAASMHASVILQKFPHFRISTMRTHFGQPITPLSYPNLVQLASRRNFCWSTRIRLNENGPVVGVNWPFMPAEFHYLTTGTSLELPSLGAPEFVFSFLQSVQKPWLVVARAQNPHQNY